MHRLLKKILLPIILLLFVTACTKDNSQSLSEKPPLSVTPRTATTTESVIRTLIRVPLDNLQQELEKGIPEVLYNSEGKERQKCVRIFGKNHCEEFRVGGWAKRTGPIQLQALENGHMRIKLPLSYKLNITTNGRIVRNLLKGINFEPAAFTTIVDIHPAIDNNWKLQLSHTSKINWQRSPVVNILGIDVSVQKILEKPIEKALKKALNKQKEKLAADTRLKQQVNNFWLKIQQPYELSGPFPIWLQATPKALHLSNIHIENNALLLSLALKANLQATHTSDNINKVMTNAPAPTQQIIKPSKVHLNLPLSLSYKQIEASIENSLLNKPVQLEQGNTSIVVNDIRIYPNNDRIVLASKVTIKGFKGWFNSAGEVYVSGKLVVDNTNHIIRLADVEFSRKLDSPFWSSATQLLQTQLLESLQKSLVYDFSSDYEAIRTSTNAKLKNQTLGKLRLQGTLNSLQVKDIYPDLESLKLILDAIGTVDLELIE